MFAIIIDEAGNNFRLIRQAKVVLFTEVVGVTLGGDLRIIFDAFTQGLFTIFFLFADGDCFFCFPFGVGLLRTLLFDMGEYISSSEKI